MKLEAPRKEFFEAVNAAGAASSARTTVNILQHLLIEATEGHIRVVGCDGEMWVERTIPGSVSAAGSICVPAKTLQDILGQLAEGNVVIEAKGDGIADLTSAASEYKLMTLDAQDFPAIASHHTEDTLTVPMGTFRDAIRSVSFAVSTDQHRAVLTGVLFKYVNGRLTLVATDTHRLAVRKIEKEGLADKIDAIVPEKALKSIQSLPVPDDGELKVNFGDNKLSVEVPGARIVSQLLSGNYPNWERVVPAESTRAWCVDTDDMLSKVKRAMILAKDSANRVRFRGNGECVIITAKSEEKGEAKEEVEVSGENGDVEIAFNGQYVRDVLGVLEDKVTRIEMTEPTRPAIFRSSEDPDSYYCVIMPMALG